MLKHTQQKVIPPCQNFPQQQQPSKLFSSQLPAPLALPLLHSSSSSSGRNRIAEAKPHKIPQFPVLWLVCFSHLFFFFHGSVLFCHFSPSFRYINFLHLILPLPHNTPHSMRQFTRAIHPPSHRWWLMNGMLSTTTEATLYHLNSCAQNRKHSIFSCSSPLNPSIQCSTPPTAQAQHNNCMTFYGCCCSTLSWWIILV